MTGQQLYDAIVAEIEGMHSSFSVKFKDESRYMGFLAVLLYPFNDQFMTRFTTTVGTTVYFPSRNELAKRWGNYARVLAHEWVHIWDSERGALRFKLGYMFPQWLMVLGMIAYAVLGSWIPIVAMVGGAVVSYLALWAAMKVTKSREVLLEVFYVLFVTSLVSFVALAICLSGWWALLAAAALIPLAPWRAYWRAEAEYRGYAMGIAQTHWKYGSVSDEVLENRAPTFTGMAYYRMDPSKKRVMRRLRAIRESCVSGDILKGKRAVPYIRVHEVLRVGGLLKVEASSA